MKYSKGEWEVVKKDKAHSLFFDGFSVSVNTKELVIALCDRDKWDHKEQRLANAHLIAAAPDMYEALRKLRMPPKSPIHKCPADISSSPCVCGWHDALHMAQKALAKAEGRGQ